MENQYWSLRLSNLRVVLNWNSGPLSIKAKKAAKSRDLAAFFYLVINH